MGPFFVPQRRVREIPLSDGKHVALVDECDYEVMCRFTWHVHRDRRGRVYARRWIGKRHVHMHREILGVAERRIQVDHIDGNGLNNTRGNLRVATNQQNSWNHRPHRRRTKPAERHSRHNGVSWYANRWRARITVSGRTRHLGRFETENEAALAYNVAAREAFGEFARLNEVP